MKWYKDRPDVGDLVVVTITDVDKNSAYADLDEYEEVRGLIHISEVSRSWLQDVSKEIDEGEKTVAQVVEADEEGTIDLSLKRVNENQKREAMARWNKEQKAEKFLEDLAEELDRDEEELYKEILFPLQKELGSSFHGFEIAEGEPGKLEEIVGEDAVEAIQKVARENINLKQEKLEGEVELEFQDGNGPDEIKEVFSEVEEGVEVKYVSAPTYSVTAWGRNMELAKKRMDSAVQTFREKADELGGEFEFNRA